MTVPMPPQPPLVDARNAEMAGAWNGAEGEDWAARADRFDAASAAFDPALLGAAGIGAADRVLDVGCGAGVSTRAAARAAPDGHVTGIDVSGPLLAEARRRSAAAGLANTTFVQGDAQVHPFEPAAFDVAVSRFGAMFFGDPVVAFGNVARALRPGGRLAVLSWQPLARNEWLLVLRRTLAAGRPLPDPPDDAPGPFGLADPDHVRRVLAAAGFGSVSVADVPGVVRLGADAEDAFDFVSGLGMTRGLLGGLDDDVRRAALDELRAALTEHATPDGVLLGAAAWLTTAHRE
ncbi:class I SAM-dependent methyltransferase [Geodermatophilus poikilotrophus]|uniref:Methyltransferase domain-containing protein n=1 Tax=Geodermatophilus poikilotrophus TaxID=1333667 RepID=A0A1I0E778_9ACTN|nr:methyltransferase domain-containing protein [Geodermatophilus poikilotrophus]SET40831.1 Methyltransferase domain-containing protein [Geodermatophilus poikilotrophus]